MGFNYHKIIGEVILSMMKCHPEISASTIKLSQYMENPAELHFNPVLSIMDFLSRTIHDGIYYWHHEPLPEVPLPTTYPDNDLIDSNTPLTEHNLYGYVDSDWGSDSTHSKSITGAVQKMFFFRSLLQDLNIEQKHATILCKDNNGTLMKANAQQPTRRTRHMDIKKFALLDWVEEDL